MSRLGYNDYNIMRSRSATPLTPEMSKILPYVSDKTISRHLGYAGRSLDMGHAKAYYNPARNAVYSRYSTNDWGMSNSMNFSLSDKERSFAERLRADAWRAVKETDTRTRNRQNDITKKLGERVYDITFWKSELNNEISAMATEIENLKVTTDDKCSQIQRKKPFSTYFVVFLSWRQKVHLSPILTLSDIFSLNFLLGLYM